MKKFLIVITSFLVIVLTACAEENGGKEIASNITTPIPVVTDVATPSPVVIDICNSNEVENKEVADEILKNHVLCLINKEEYNQVNTIIVSHNKQNVKVFEALRLYAIFFINTADSIKSTEDLTKYGEDTTPIYDKIENLPSEEFIALSYLLKNVHERMKEKANENLARIDKEYREKFYAPAIGMTAEKVEKSQWGKPTDINKTTTKYGVTEQWVYSRGYVYFEDGVVTSIQE